MLHHHRHLLLTTTTTTFTSSTTNYYTTTTTFTSSTTNYYYFYYYCAGDFQQQLRAKDEEYVRTLKQQHDDINELIHRIRSEFKELQFEYSKELGMMMMVNG